MEYSPEPKGGESPLNIEIILLLTEFFLHFKSNYFKYIILN
jgi:hypothetical protein